jgi:type III secretion protein U
MEEKTHAPTPKKLRDARQRGEVVHSSDVASSLAFVVLVVSLWLLPGVVVDLFRALWAQACDPELWAHADSRWVDVAQHAVTVLLLVCVPFCALAALTGAFGSFLQIGGLAAWSRLQPDVSRLNPGEGLKKLFSLNNLIELAKMLVKVLLLGAMLYVVLRTNLSTASRIGYLAPASQLSVAGHALMSMFGWAAVIFVAMAPVDYLHRRFEFLKKQRISFKDLVREHQETEGSPLNQQRRRSVQFEAVFRSLPDRISASTIVVRSLDLAVALQYLEIDTPPRVMAVGRGSVAEQINKLAAARPLYIELNAALAERLAHEVPLDRPVPPALMAPLRQVWNRAQGQA